MPYGNLPASEGLNGLFVLSETVYPDGSGKKFKDIEKPYFHKILVVLPLHQNFQETFFLTIIAIFGIKCWKHNLWKLKVR